MSESGSAKSATSPQSSDSALPAKKGMLRILWDTLSTTVLSKCWPVLIWTGIWSSIICFLNRYTHGKLSIEGTLITVFGTVLGFVISFRTTSSFDRYNDGRRYWSQIVLNCRIFARTVWFHVPGVQGLSYSDEDAISAPGKGDPEEGQQQHREAMTLIEKKTVINLLEAYAVAVKHYLRGEDGINYEDLYPLVPFRHSRYPFPAIIPPADLRNPASPESTLRVPAAQPISASNQIPDASQCSNDLESQCGKPLPAELPPKHCWRTAFPFPLLYRVWTVIREDVGKNAHQEKPKRKNNVPLEISLYLASYISALQSRKVLEDPTLNMLHGTLNQLVDALTGLERVISTPIPVSYTSHLWMITTVYCGTLPFQLWSTFEWFTVPACVMASLVFFGFIVAGEEIESYDKNDLDMGTFVRKIIREELRAITATPAPKPGNWAFSPDNNFLGNQSNESPDDWLKKGKEEILKALHRRYTSTPSLGDVRGAKLA
ncbi:UPF0187-domain-containing protein [Rhizopogon salebrosus TDB-379]|nr:UPF0187-domain-containing protein [Rhizopogon salebrosus TDB-379]